MKLHIGNKAYSSWSLRPWIAMKAAGLAFEENVIILRQPDTKARILAVSPNGKVPVLHDGDVIVPESIAILEYVAELAPALWPADREARAHARAIAAEMHAGFLPLRQRCATNFRRAPKCIAISDEVRANVERIVAIWTETRARHGAGGDFLFGTTFTNADAMFAPVVNRFHVYDIAVSPVARRYMDAVMATPMWRDWIDGAEAEPHSIADIDAIA